MLRMKRITSDETRISMVNVTNTTNDDDQNVNVQASNNFCVAKIENINTDMSNASTSFEVTNQENAIIKTNVEQNTYSSAVNTSTTNNDRIIDLNTIETAVHCQEITELRQEIETIKSELIKIHQRNNQRDYDKTFESSATRIITIMTITYIIIYIYMKYFLHISNPELNAIVPTLGFNMSTWSLNWVKMIWFALKGRGRNTNESRL